jgi:hypothetical protein
VVEKHLDEKFCLGTTAKEEKPAFFNELMRYVAALVLGKESKPSFLDSLADQLPQEEEVKGRVLEMEKRCL